MKYVEELFSDTPPEQISRNVELYHLLNEGLAAEKAGRYRPFSDAMADIRERLANI